MERGWLGFEAFDADSHYYEPYDCFTRHIEDEFAERTVRAVKTDDGPARLFLGDAKLTFTKVNPGDWAAPPGALLGAFTERDGRVGFTQVDAVDAHEVPLFTDREARLAAMDEQGIAGAIILPTLGLLAEHEMRHDVPLLCASLRAFNRWIEDDWGYDHRDRIFAVPVLSLMDLGAAVAELERVLAAGARLVHLCPSPVGGRSPADPLFDPFWARVQEAGVPVVFHISNSGYNASAAAQWGEDPRNASHRMAPLQWFLGGSERPITDTLAALTLHNLFGRFPGVRVLSIENGSDWVPHFLKQLDKAQRLGGRGPMLGGALPDRASDMFREHAYVVPFPEEDPLPLVEVLGADHVLFGSDFPHPEGLPRPLEVLDGLRRCDDETRRKIMRENAFRLLRIGPG